MEHVPGTPAEKLAWLRSQMAAGRLDGDDPDEVAQAEALLSMLVRLSAASGSREKRHLDEASSTKGCARHFRRAIQWR